MSYNLPLVRDKPLGVPASVKHVYFMWSWHAVLCKRDVTPLLTHSSYDTYAPTHQADVVSAQLIYNGDLAMLYSYPQLPLWFISYIWVPRAHFTNNFSTTIQIWLKYSFYFHLNSNQMIATNFAHAIILSWYFQKFVAIRWPSLSISGVTAIRLYHLIWIVQGWF